MGKVCDYIHAHMLIITLTLAVEVLSLVCAAVVHVCLCLAMTCATCGRGTPLFLPGNFVAYSDSPILLDAVSVPVAQFFSWSHSCEVPNLNC